MILIPPDPLPRTADLMSALRALKEKARTPVRPHDLEARDESFIARLRPLMGFFYDTYLRCETEIEEDLPDGPLLAVGNHNGMTGTPDMFCHMVAFWRRYSPARVAYGLMHDMPFHTPFAGTWLNAAGAIGASPENARRALERGAAVLVFPGGDMDACRPFAKRYVIDFGNRRGFIRTAIREQVPIVPIVSVGGHHSLYIWSDGRKVAEWLHLPKLARSNVAPLGLAMPWGLIVGVPLPHLPPPVKIHTRFLKPIHLDLPKSAEHDEVAVERSYVRVVTAMQDAMDDLRDAGRHGLLPKK